MTSSPELTPLQITVLERLVERGFRVVAFPLYATAVGVRRDSFAALLVPVEDGSFRILGQAHYLIDGNLSVQVQVAGAQQFVWKGKSVEVTTNLLVQRRQFAEELELLLVAR